MQSHYIANELQFTAWLVLLSRFRSKEDGLLCGILDSPAATIVATFWRRRVSRSRGFAR